MHRDAVATAVIGGIAVVILIVWKFSTAVGLDMNTGGWVLAYMICWGAAFVGALTLLNIPFGSLLPLALATLWMCWWPALDYWASQQLFYPQPFGGFPESGSTTVWWSAWYTKAGVLIAILGAGYGVRAWRSSAY